MPGAPGVWYSLVGIGETIRVLLTAQFDTQVTVFSGPGCEELSCVTGNDQAPWSNGSSEVILDSKLGETYFILVHGYDSDIGEFFINIDSVARPSNDFCTNASTLETGDEITGSTALASFDDTSSCGGAFGGNQSAPGIWYQVTGVDATLQVTVAAAFDMQISVFTGPNCEGLVCVDGTDGDPPQYTSGHVTWDATKGEKYYILLHGFVQQVGMFELMLGTVERPANDLCASAIPLNFDSSLNETTALASIDYVEACGTASGGDLSSPGLWYSVNGGGGALSVTVTSDYNVQVSIFSGATCDSLICIDGRAGEDPSMSLAKLVWDSEENTQYWILVHGLNEDTGNFQIVVSEVERPPNDACSSAIELNVGDTVAGSTSYARMDGIQAFCGNANNNSAPGVWYFIRGAGEDDITAVFSTEYDAQLSVFKGSDCSSLVCVDGSEGDRPTYTSGSVTWASHGGEMYYILLHGFNKFVGDFELTITEGASSGTIRPSGGPAPSNDVCENALAIEGGQTIDGSTVSASPDEIVYINENCGEYVPLLCFIIYSSVMGSFSNSVALYFPGHPTSPVREYGTPSLAREK